MKPPCLMGAGHKGKGVLQESAASAQAANTKEQLDEEEHEEMAHDAQAAGEKNLDSGYAWLILLIMFLLQSSVSGSSRVYGIVYAKEVAIGYYDREEASWPIATASAVENLAGILTPALAQWMSWRQMELLSTSLLITANLLAYFSSSLELDIIALGLIQGLALSTYTVLSLVINNDYFERYRTTAYGLSMSGSTFGVLYLGPLVTWLLESYEDFRLVYLALAGVFACNIILVLFIKPRCGNNTGAEGQQQQQQQQQQGLSNVQNNNNNPGQAPRVDGEQAEGAGFGLSASRKVSRFESHFERKSSIASVSYGARSRRQSVLSRVAATSPQVTNREHQVHPSQLIKSKSGIELANHLGGPRATRSQQELEAVMKKISLSSMRGSRNLELLRAPQDQNHYSSADNSLSCDTISSSGGLLSRQNSRTSMSFGAGKTATSPFYLDATSPNHNEQITQANCAGGASELLELDLSLFRRLGEDPEASTLPGSSLKRPAGDLVIHDDDQTTIEQHQQLGELPEQRFSLKVVGDLLKLPYLHCAWIMLALYYLIARIFVIILVDFAHDHGFGLGESTNLLNYWSMGELVGRVLLGSLIDLKFLSCKSCITLTCTAIACLIMCMVFIQSYLVYALCSSLIAALISVEYMLINVMMVEYLGKNSVTNCYSLAACISSVVLFARPSMIGFFRDRLGSYDGLLLLLASLALIFALLFYLLEPLLVRLWPKACQKTI